MTSVLVNELKEQVISISETKDILIFDLSTQVKHTPITPADGKVIKPIALSSARAGDTEGCQFDILQRIR